MTETYRRKVSGKGQVVVAKPLRGKHGIEEGGWVRQFSTGNGVLLVPVSVDGLLEELEEVASEVGEAWQEDVSAVEGVRGIGRSVGHGSDFGFLGSGFCVCEGG